MAERTPEEVPQAAKAVELPYADSPGEYPGEAKVEREHSQKVADTTDEEGQTAAGRISKNVEQRRAMLDEEWSGKVYASGPRSDCGKEAHCSRHE